MPYVSIRVAGTLTKEQKHKPKEAILIFIDEECRENIAKAGVLLEDM
jgi:4-oxalocrotonate tautomerase